MEDFIKLSDTTESEKNTPLEIDSIDLSNDSTPMSLNRANWDATIYAVAAKRIKGLSPEETEDTYNFFHHTLLQDETIRIEEELLSLKKQRELEISQALVSQASEEGDTQLIKDITDYNYEYDPKKDLFIIQEEFANEVIESGAKDADREIQLTNEINQPIEKLSWTDITTDILTEKTLVTKYMKKYMDRLGWNTIPELILGAVPLYTMNSYSQKIKTGDGKDNPFWAGEDIEAQVLKFKAMSIEDKAQALKELDDFFSGQNKFSFDTFSLEKIKADSEGQANNLLALTYFSYLMDFGYWDRISENALHGVDMLLPILPGAIKGVLASRKILSARKAIKDLKKLGEEGHTIKVTQETTVNGKPKTTTTTVTSTELKANETARNIANNLIEGKITIAGVHAGNRSSAVDQVVATGEAIRKGEQAKDTDIAHEAAELTGTTSLNPLGSIGDTVGISGRLETKLQRIEKIAEDLASIDQVKVFDDVEELKDLMRVRVIEEMTETGMQHVDILRYVDDDIKEGMDGINYIMYYGNEVGEGFKDVKTAKKHIKLLKLDGATVTTIEENNTHFIKLKKAVDIFDKNPSGFIVPYKDIQTSNGARILLGSPTNYIDTSSRLAGHKVLGIQENVTHLGRKLIKVINALNVKETAVLGEVLEYGRTFEKWFSPSELKYRFNLTDKQVLAYHAIRRMEDTNHIILNSAEYSRKQRSGYKTLEIKNKAAIDKGIDKNFDAKIIDEIENPINKTIYNVSTNKYVDITSTKQLEKLKKEGYIFASFEGTVDTEKLAPFQYIIGRSDDITVKPLTFNQVPYVAGGRIEYAGTHFVKQGRLRTTAGGANILLKSRTHGVGREEEAIEWATRMEDGRIIALQSIDPNGKVVATTNLNEKMLEATGGLYDVERYVEYVGVKNLNMPFEVVTDGQELSSVAKKVGEGVKAHLNDIKEANSIQRMINRNRFGDHRSKRGDRLFGFDGNPAPVINPFETAVNSLSRSLHLVTLDKWKARHIEKFYKTFNGILDDAQNKTPHQHFFNLKFREKLNKEDAKLKRKAEAMIQHYRAILNTPTKAEEVLKEKFIHNLADVFNSVSKKIGFPARYETIDNLKNADPVKMVRSLAFHGNLGLYNPKQFAIQLQATLLMMSANLDNGPKAAAIMWPMRFMLMSENPKTLGNMTKTIGRIVGVKPDEIKEIYDVLQKSGSWRLLSGSLLEQEEKLFSASTVAQKVLDFGKTPFIESERLNKIASTIASTLDWKKANPGKKITEEAIDIIRSQSELYLANMNRVDRSSWQRGFMSIPTQFWSYQSRALEMMLPGFLGGSKNFTGGQKFRMIIAQLGMYGVGGAFGPKYGMRFRDTFAELYEERYEEKPPEELLDLIEGGGIESLLSLAVGDDINFSHRAGLGLSEGGWAGVVWNAFEGNWDELNKIDAAGFTAIRKLSGLTDIIRIFNPASDYFLTREQFLAAGEVFAYHLRDAFSGVDAHAKAYLALRYKQTFDKQGRVVDRDTTTTEAILGWLGLDPSNESDLRAMEQAVLGESAYKKTVVNVLAKNFSESLKVNTPEGWKKYLDLRKFMIGSLDEEERKDINTQIENKATGGKPITIRYKYFKKFGYVRKIDN